MLLRAGPLRLIFREGVFRYIKLDEREILRAVYVAVRDANWRTIPGVLSNLDIRSTPDRFNITFDCAHCERDIDFRWKADVFGNADGSIVWRIEGKAWSSFQKNRIGICLLHPIAECAGESCLITHSDGTKERSSFPQTVAPHQPFLDLKEMSYRVTAGLDADIAFAGECFETEDQRNWTDASFKTYSTPLSWPHPVKIEAGSTLKQSVSLSLRGAIPISTNSEKADDEVRLTLRPELRTRLPHIGFKDSDPAHRLSDEAVQRLKSLHLDHLSVDLNPGEKCSEESLWKSAARANLLGLPLEIALAPNADVAEMRHILQEVVRRKVNICRWLVDVQMQHQGLDSFLGELQAIASAALGSGANFAELNRNRPSSSPEGGVWFSLNPQVHASDDTTLIENLAAQSCVLRCIQEWMGAAPVTVSPVCLSPRIVRQDGCKEHSRENDAPPFDVDQRQMSLFGAGWTLGSLKYLAEGGAANVTYYETVGWKGVMESETGPLLPSGFKSSLNPVYPMYHVFADLADFKEAEVVCTESSDPLRVYGMALIQSDRMRIMIANFRPDKVRMDIRLAHHANKAEIREINEENAEAAMLHPETHRQQSGCPLVEHDGALRFELNPFAIATIDALQLRPFSGKASRSPVSRQ